MRPRTAPSDASGCPSRYTSQRCSPRFSSPMCLPYSVAAMGPTLPAFTPPASPSAVVTFPTPMTCHACGAQLSPGGRFCHKCGAAVGVQAAGWRAGLPWGIAGVALGALVAVIAINLRRADSTEQPTPPSSMLRPPDISQMTPEERANRLFNRVMVLAEAGKTDSVRFFLPMALGAYCQLPQLDADARYHVGLLQLAGGH